MAESNLYEDSEIKITDKRIVIGSRSYPLKQIASVSVTRTGPDYSAVMGESGPLGFLFGAFFVVFMGSALCSAVTGWNIIDHLGTVLTWGTIIIVVGGIIVMINMKPSFNLRLGISSGEVNVLSSKDSAYIHKLSSIINSALIDL